MADLELNSIGNGDGNNYLLRDNSKIPLSGTNALAGSIVPSTDNTYDLGSSSKAFKIVYTYGIHLQANGSVIQTKADTDHLEICGGNGWLQGSMLFLMGKNEQNLPGYFQLYASNGTDNKILQGTPSGTLTWAGKNIAMQEDTVPRSGGAVFTSDYIGRTASTGRMVYGGGADNNGGACLLLYGKDSSIRAGEVAIQVYDGTNDKNMRLHPNGTWTWNGTACQITSDQRLKQQIAQIDDDLLTAWEDVNPVQFKYNDAVETKSDNARLHTGYVVQQIDDACKKHNVDVSKYGLYCHEEYAEETREVEHEDGTKTIEVVRPASEHYSLRYTEALIVECAYLRRENSRLKERLSKIEKLLNI